MSQPKEGSSMDDLISRKALLEAYDKAHQGPPGGARKLIEEAPGAVKWISVKDRLPDGQYPVLVYVPPYTDGNKRYLGYVGMAYHTSLGEGFWAGTDGNVYGAIGFIHGPTHWMPLPEKPRGYKMAKVHYICDSNKNTSCSKAGCRLFNCCQCTTNPKYAKTGQNGKPIVAVRSDLIAGEIQP